jgi:O-antigen ligase
MGDVRLLYWKDTLEYITERPWFGHGGGASFAESLRYQVGAIQYDRLTQLIHPHNEYLSLLADYGLLGFGLFLLIPVSGAVWVKKRIQQRLTDTQICALAGRIVAVMRSGWNPTLQQPQNSDFCAWGRVLPRPHSVPEFYNP